ncbi:MAG: GGDEF domain-containing protein [Actinomycetia bacterium]|nr:GGDEF domain-containing protein [Actinomycetes bacterium]
MSRWLVAAAVCVASVVGTTPSAARARELTQPPSEDWSEMALVGATFEMVVLAELDAFAPNPTLEELTDQIGLDHLTRDELLSELGLVEADNDVLLGLLHDTEWGWLGEPVDLVLSELPEPLFRKIENGETEVLDVGLWLDAVTDLAIRRGAEPRLSEARDRGVVLDVLRTLDSTAQIDLDSRTLVWVLDAAEVGLQDVRETIGVTGVVSTTTTPVTTTLAAETTVAPAGLPAVDSAHAADAETSAGSSNTLLAASIVVGLLVLAGASLVFVRRKRRGHRPSVSTEVGTMLDVSRRMMSALDEDTTKSIAVDESLRMTGADATGFFGGMSPGVTVVAASSPGVFTEGEVQSGLVNLVFEMGQRTRQIVDSDPAIEGGPFAAAAIPVVIGGEVGGVIVVVRGAAKPFSSDNMRSLEMLASVTGAALQAATAHSTAITAADVDGLTQLHNRRRLDNDLGVVSGLGVCFAMIDVDHFKQFNDTFGHRAGDRALQIVARTIEESVRALDVVYRYGGEEFSVLLHDCGLDEASEVLERVRAAVSLSPIELAGGVIEYVTVSVGVAPFRGDPDGAEALAAAADAALYLAKKAGRDRVVVAKPPTT